MGLFSGDDEDETINDEPLDFDDNGDELDDDDGEWFGDSDEDDDFWAGDPEDDEDFD